MHGWSERKLVNHSGKPFSNHLPETATPSSPVISLLGIIVRETTQELRMNMDVQNGTIYNRETVQSISTIDYYPTIKKSHLRRIFRDTGKYSQPTY